jgi:hypothetical protein
LKTIDLSFQHSGILKSVDDAQPPGGLRALDVTRRADLQETVWVCRETRFPLSDARDGLLEEPLMEAPLGN